MGHMLGDNCPHAGASTSLLFQGALMRLRIPVGLTLLTFLFACSDRSAPLAPDAVASDKSPAISASVASRIAELRRLVAPFHQFEKARAAGWSAQITPCLVAADLPSQPGAGAMGFHYGRPEF